MKSLFHSALYFARFAVIGLLVALLTFVYVRREALWTDAVDAPPTAEVLQASYARAVERASPAVVNVYADKIIEGRTLLVPNLPPDSTRSRMVFSNPLFQPRTELGSGVIADPDGYIVTNFHVVRDAGDIFVSLWDGRVTRAELVGADLDTDLAVLRIGLTGLPAAPTRAAEDLRVGDVVLAIGNPFGLGKTVTMGIVSATGRSDLAMGPYEDFIQTDAAINRGNSGGALVNANGEVVGINTAMLEHEDGAEGIGFAIPMTMAVEVLDQIRQHGRVIRGWLGVQFRDPRLMPRRPVALTDEPGMVVAGVFPDGPAEAAGLKFGDYLTHFDGVQVTTLRDLYDRIAQTPPGTRVSIRVVRGVTGIQTEAVLAERPAGVFDSS